MANAKNEDLNCIFGRRKSKSAPSTPQYQSEVRKTRESQIFNIAVNDFDAKKSARLAGCSFKPNSFWAGPSVIKMDRVPTRPGKPGKMRVHLENLEISWNFEKFNKYHGKMT